MTDYTPTTEDVRSAYAMPLSVTESLDPEAHYRALEEFDRWYDEEIRKAKAEAWQEGVVASGINLDWQLHLSDHNPYKEEA